jgi:hypothetical protein
MAAVERERRVRRRDEEQVFLLDNDRVGDVEAGFVQRMFTSFGARASTRSIRDRGWAAMLRDGEVVA